MSAIFHGLNAFFFILGGGALILAIVAAVSTARFQFHLRHMSGLKRPEFVEFFAEKEGASRVAELVFDEFRTESFSKGFRFPLEADLGEVFRQDAEDIFEVMTKIANELGFRSPSDDDLQAIRLSNPFTAKHLIERLIALRK